MEYYLYLKIFEVAGPELIGCIFLPGISFGDYILLLQF
jgi:hypothetical protein